MSREEQAPAWNRFKMETSWTGLGLWKRGLHGSGCSEGLGAGLGGSELKCLGQKSLLTALKWSLDAAERVLPLVSCSL